MNLHDWEQDALKIASRLRESSDSDAADCIELMYAKIIEMRVAYCPESVREKMTPLGRNIMDILIDQNKRLLQERA